MRRKLSEAQNWTNASQLYYVWYGGWGNINNQGTASRPTTVKVLTDMAQSIGGTPWFKIGTTYSDQNGNVVNKIQYGGRTAITASNKCWQVGRAIPHAHHSCHASTINDSILV